MPNRILRDSILDSEAVNKLSYEAEVFYRRLLSVVDDHGLMDARPSILLAKLYPLRLSTVSEGDITRWLGEVGKFGLIRTYEVGGRPYLVYEEMGTARARLAKYPPPPELQGILPYCKPAAALGRDTPASNRAQPHAVGTYSYSDSYSDSYSTSTSQPPKPASGEEVKKRKKPAGSGRAKAADQPSEKERRQNPLFNAVADVCRIDRGSATREAMKLVGIVQASLAAAEVPYTAEEVLEFGRRFWELCPWAGEKRAVPTPSVLEKNIHLVRAKRVRPPAAPSANPFALPPKPTEGTDAA